MYNPMSSPFAATGNWPKQHNIWKQSTPGQPQPNRPAFGENLPGGTQGGIMGMFNQTPNFMNQIRDWVSPQNVNTQNVVRRAMPGIREKMFSGFQDAANYLGGSGLMSSSAYPQALGDVARMAGNDMASLAARTTYDAAQQDANRQVQSGLGLGGLQAGLFGTIGNLAAGQGAQDLGWEQFRSGSDQWQKQFDRSGSQWEQEFGRAGEWRDQDMDRWREQFDWSKLAPLLQMLAGRFDPNDPMRGSWGRNLSWMRQMFGL